MPRSWLALALAALLTMATPALAVPPPVEAYGRLPAIEQVSLSPSGQRYAFVATVGDVRRLVAASADGQTVLFAVETGSAKVVRIEWAGEDHLLVTALHTNHLDMSYTVSQVETATTLAINIKTQTSFVVFKDMRILDPVVIGRYGTALIKGRWYGYFGGQTNLIGNHGQFMGYQGVDLYRVDLDSGDAVAVAHGGRDPRGWVVAPDGAVIARVARNAKSGAWRILVGPNEDVLLASGESLFGDVSVAPGRTPDTLLVQQPADRGGTLQELPLPGAPARPPPAVANAGGILTDPVTGLWIGVLGEGDRPEPHFFDPGAQARAAGALKAFPGLTARLHSFTPDLGRMIVETSGRGDSGTFWLVDVAAGKADPIGAAYPDVKSVSVGPSRWCAGPPPMASP